MADEDTPDEVLDTEELEEEFVAEPEDLDEALVVDDAVEPAPKPKAPATKGRRSDDEDEEEEDEDLDPDDVEADLDTILKDRIAAQPDEGDEEDEEEQPETDERGDGTGRIQPKRPGEFVCQSCFLVKHPSQLADPDQMLCTDCV